MTTYGVPQSVWDRAKLAAREILLRRGASGQPIFYSDLAEQIRAVHPFDPHSAPFFMLLDEMSREENADHGVMLSALVVTKANFQPGRGFYDLARALERTDPDDDSLWRDEFNAAVAHCRAQSKPKARPAK